MKILLLCNKSPWPPNDGGAYATLCMIRGLSRCKASLTVLSFNTRKHFSDPSDIPPEYRNIADFNFVNIDTTISPLRLIKNLLFSKKPYINERFESCLFEEKLSALLKEDFDIIQLEGLNLCGYLPIIRQKSTARVVFRPHNIESRIWFQLSEEEKNPFRKLYFRILAERIRKVETEIINEFDGVAAITSLDLNWFRSNGLQKPAAVVSPGVEIMNLTNSPVKDNSGIFFIGALDWMPNINGLRWFVRKIWPLILKVLPDTTLSIAGRNAPDNIVRFLKRSNISFSGEVASSSAFMSDKSVMIVPLYSGSGIRIKIIEGMSLGKCIVTTHRGAEGVDYIDKRDLFIADTGKDFADRVTELLKNPGLIRQTGLNAVENVRKNYNILASTEKLLKFYSELTA